MQALSGPTLRLGRSAVCIPHRGPPAGCRVAHKHGAGTGVQGSLIIITVDRSAGDDELPLSIQNAHFRDLGLDEAFSCAVCRGTGAVFLPQLYADGREFGGAVDVEPEFVAVSDDGATAYVMLQENNAVAIVDVASGADPELLRERVPGC